MAGKFKTFAAAAVLTAAMLTSLGCDDKISEANYDKITTGMTITQVEHILGKGTLDDTTGVNLGAGGLMSGSGGTSQTKYTWRKGNLTISVTLDKDGKLIQKAKS